MPKRTHDGIRKRCDCPARQWPKCSHPWHFSFHFGGKPYRYSLDEVARARNEKIPTTKGDAVAWRDKLRNEIRSSAFLDPHVPPAPVDTSGRRTLGNLSDEYVKAHVEVPTRRELAQKAMRWTLTLIRRTVIPNG